MAQHYSNISFSSFAKEHNTQLEDSLPVIPTTHCDVTIAAQRLMGARHQLHIIVAKAFLYQYPGKLRSNMMGNAMTI